jgi:hypothetical protein
MDAPFPAEGQITRPPAIQRLRGLKQGAVLQFDENAPVIKACKPFDLAAMGRAIGRGKKRSGRGTSKAWIDELRGPAELS